MPFGLNAALVIALAASACAVSVSQHSDGPIPTGCEIAMAPLSTITATNAVGTITVKAGKGRNRCYTWDGGTRCIEMWPRTSRWQGSLGIYFPGPGEHWDDNHGITRGVVEEGQMHFATVDEAMAWLKARDRYMPHVHRNDGLVVGWKKEPSRKQLNVEVWQFLIAGAKPVTLPGSTDAAITVAPGATATATP
jgi:hypothetical protein